MILARDPICKMCERRPSEAVDHIISKAKGGSDDAANLQGLCTRCHAAKTLRDAADGRKNRR